ncbi:hypothetical protein [Acidaminococcus fermentans]|uniref:hypothetical protein n=1 Tax=Acidaminococcus fermentans TaxID=905 RepID=UPI003F8B1A81
MELTHVCEWNQKEHCWKRITNAEAAKKYPHGARVDSGLFMCELCNHYVTLTQDSKLRKGHFVHSRGDEIKDCPDRNSNQDRNNNFSPENIGIPLKLVLKNNSFDHIEVGFSPAFSKNFNGTVEIRANEITLKKYSAERFFSEIVTYLDIGKEFYPSYEIIFYSEDNKPLLKDPAGMKNPRTVEGFIGDVVLFDGKTGKKIPKDGNVTTNHPYYLLVQQKQAQKVQSVEIHQLDFILQEGKEWRLYEILCTGYNESSARFFFDCHARLSEKSVQMLPVWPPCIQNGNLLYHKEQDLYFELIGEYMDIRAYPGNIQSSAKMQLGQREVLAEVKITDAHQILSMGRQSVLQYVYLWEDSLKREGNKKLILSVKDGDGNSITPGEPDQLPQQQQMRILSSVDGFIKVYNNQKELLEYDELNADTELWLDGNQIRRGNWVEIYQGLDCVWKIRFLYRKSVHISTARDSLYQKIRRMQGPYQQTGLDTARLAELLKDNIAIYCWLKQQIMDGKISKRAWEFLVRYYRELQK